MDIDHAARELIRQALSAAAELSVGLVNLWLEEAVKRQRWDADFHIARARHHP